MRLAFLSTALSLSIGLGIAVSACNDECSRVGDCPVGEVCQAGVCTGATADYLQCSSTAECGAGDSGLFVCLGGRCTLSGSIPEVGVITDSGTSTMTDTGP